MRSRRAVGLGRGEVSAPCNGHVRQGQGQVTDCSARSVRGGVV
jgi:hypothetical protein